jgi:hypothetical protein
MNLSSMPLPYIVEEPIMGGKMDGGKLIRHERL